jgi:hypothetical protein
MQGERRYDLVLSEFMLSHNLWHASVGPMQACFFCSNTAAGGSTPFLNSDDPGMRPAEFQNPVGRNPARQASAECQETPAQTASASVRQLSRAGSQ